MAVADMETDHPGTEPEAPAAAPPEHPVEEQPAADLPAPLVEDQPPPASLSLEERVRRLEDIVASLHLPPPIRGDLPPPPVAGIVPEPPAAPAPPPPPPPPYVAPPGTNSTWLLFELYAEMRAIIHMYLDPRYRLGWRTRLLVPLFIVGIVLSKWMIGGIYLIGWLLDLPISMLLLYAMFKVLSREATRYRMTSPDLPPALRL